MVMILMADSHTAIKGTSPGYDGSEMYDPWMILAAAIVKQAVEDYIDVLRALWKNSGNVKDKNVLLFQKIQLESFFYGTLCGYLTDDDPKALMSQCRARAKEQEMAAIALENRRKIQKALKIPDAARGR